MPESKPFHEQHTKRECYYFKVSVFATWTALHKQWDLLPWENQMFQEKTPKPSCLEDSYRREEIHPPDQLMDFFVGGMGLLFPFLFLQAKCTFQAEMHKSVFHSHVLIVKSLNMRLLWLPPLSYRNCPCFIKILDIIGGGFLVFF